MDQTLSRLYIIIAGLITAMLALAVFAAAAPAGALRLGSFGLALITAAAAISLLATLRLRTRSLVARLRGVAYEDPLTGLPNRASAEDHIDTLLRAPAPEPFALVIVELRNIREINADLGHPVGDEALREVARRLRQNVEPADLVARVAASQFLIIPARLQQRAGSAPCAAARGRDPRRAAPARREPRHPGPGGIQPAPGPRRHLPRTDAPGPDRPGGCAKSARHLVFAYHHRSR